ncbi:MAG TPA: phytanoyl-CoA dioxygenase family protein [Acidimicrobiales bacterium]|nr:phytanoyl-CoA dioxygenase family protein [Acidimicrobiales bacterium]
MFCDPAVDAAMARDGYVTVPFLSSDEVEEILEGYRRIVPTPDEGVMAFDYMRPDRSAMEAVAGLLAPYWERHLPGLFVDHDVVFSTFVIKPPSADSTMYLHDDRTYVDESRHRSCTVWIPLVDTSPELRNGCLHVVVGSHRIMTAASGTNTPDWIRPFEGYLAAHATPVSVPAGSALVYDTRTVHSSPPNLSDRPRPAIAAAMAPRGAELIHVFADDLHHRRVFAIDKDFFVRWHPRQLERRMPPDYPLIREYDEPVVDADPAVVAAVCDPSDIPVPTGPAAIPEPPPPPEGLDLEPGGSGSRRARFWRRLRAGTG